MSDISTPSSESRSSLPEGWKETSVGDYLYLKNGYAFKSHSYVPSGEGTFPVIRISDLDGQGASDLNAVHVENGMQGFEVKSGDLLIAMSGATTGKVGVYRGNEPAYQNQRVGNLKLHAEKYGCDRYKNYLISALSDQILEIAYGGAQPNISGKSIESIEISLPPLAEQKVIADKLDQLLAQVESTKARLDRIPGILKRFRQSVLAAAVSGKLTEEWRGTQKDLTYNFIEQGKAKCKKELFEQSQRDLPGIPSEWKVFPASCLFEYVTSGSRGWSKYYSDSGALFLRMSNVRYDTTKLDLEDLQYVSLPESVEGKRSLVKIDDLIISITADVGRVARIDRDLGEAYINQHIALARPVKDVHSEYLALCIASKNIGIKQIQALKRGATKAGLGLDDIRSLAIPVPSIQEQEEIIRRVEQFFINTDKIEQQVQQAQERVNNLIQSILAKAFRGELTEQWRKGNLDLISGDNSAEALLAKIKAEREAAKPKKKTRKKATV